MYRLSNVIPNDTDLNLIPEVAFSPDGAVFAITYQETHEVRVFDTQTRAVLRVYRNPEASLDNPHGILITRNHLVITNTHGLARPSTFTVYRLADPGDTPVSIFQTPYAQLREAHSLDMHNDLLVASYCHSADGSGALVAYQFDDEAGRITTALDICRLDFDQYGDPKGLAFSEDGRHVYFTYVTAKPMAGLDNVARALKAARIEWQQTRVQGFARYVRRKVLKRANQAGHSAPELKNGIAVLAISERGQFSPEPEKTMQRETFCRLENISIMGETVIISDTINGAVSFHNLTEDPELVAPAFAVTENMTLPHGAKLSPDKRILVVTNYGLKAKKQIIHWKTPDAANKNRVLVYDLQAT